MQLCMHMRHIMHMSYDMSCGLGRQTIVFFGGKFHNAHLQAAFHARAARHNFPLALLACLFWHLCARARADGMAVPGVRGAMWCLSICMQGVHCTALLRACHASTHSKATHTYKPPRTPRQHTHIHTWTHWKATASLHFRTCKSNPCGGGGEGGRGRGGGGVRVRGSAPRRCACCPCPSYFHKTPR
jgi:hypothetical protein